jgi:integrase
MASICKIDGKWRALIRRKGRPQITKRFEKKSDAERWAREIEDQLDAGRLPERHETVSDMIKEYRRLRDLSRPIDDKSTEHYTLKTLDRHLGKKSAVLTVEDLIAFAVERKSKERAGPYTINCDISKLGTIYRYASNGIPEVMNQARAKLKYLGLIGDGGKRERRPEDDEFARILGALEQPYRDATLFACITAMRQGEVTRILRADVNDKKKTVIIRDRKHPRNKIGNNEEIALLGDSWEIIRRQPEHASGKIFPINPHTLSNKFTWACRDLNIPDLHFHDLRHEGISAMFERGYDIPQVALVSGHKDWRHLRRYTNLKPESLHDLKDKPPKP